MEHECNIVRDLLPLYAENLLSEETAAFVRAHLNGCAACSAELAQMQSPAPRPAQTLPLEKLRRKLTAMKVRTVILTAVLVAALIVSAVAALGAPEYFSYSPELLTVEPAEDGALRLIFDERVTEYRWQTCRAPEGWYYEIEAWTTLWDRWFGGEKASLTATLPVPEGATVLYVPNDGTETVCLYGQMDGGMVVLPRLALNAYLFFALVLLALAAGLWILLRKKTAARTVVERIGLYPLAYVLSHCLISGVEASSYSMQRDFFLTLFLSVLLYCALRLAHSILYLKLEIKHFQE